MINKLLSRNYKCGCGEELKQYVWDFDLQTYEFDCTKCLRKVGLSNLQKEKKVEATSIRTPTKNR